MEYFLRKILAGVVEWFIKYGGAKNEYFFDDTECPSLTEKQIVKVTLEFEKES